jgi:hypothetical protein
VIALKRLEKSNFRRKAVVGRAWSDEAQFGAGSALVGQITWA